MSFDEVMARKGRVDRAKIEAMTEEDIRRYQIEDGQDPDAPLDGFAPWSWLRRCEGSLR